MAKVKQEAAANEKPVQFNVRLATADKIKSMIVNVGKSGKKFAELVHTTGVQCILHAQKHGDATLADTLVQTVRANTPGYVWQGLVLWFRRHSPIAWDAEGKVYLLKEGEKGYKPFNPAQADAEPAGKAKEVTNRTDKPIEPMSISLLKGRIKGMIAQVKRAGEEGGRGFAGETPEQREQTQASTTAWINRVAMVIDSIDAKPEAAINQKEGAKEEKAAA